MRPVLRLHEPCADADPVRNHRGNRRETSMLRRRADMNVGKALPIRLLAVAYAAVCYAVFVLVFLGSLKLDVQHPDLELA